MLPVVICLASDSLAILGPKFQLVFVVVAVVVVAAAAAVAKTIIFNHYKFLI